MPEAVEQSLRDQHFLKSAGPHVRVTVHRRRSATDVTGDILTKLLATCETGSIRDLLDRAT